MSRYIRQETLNGFGESGQYNLTNAHILVIGAGGLGSALLPLLGAAGVGKITIVDHDEVSISNLHRQVLHTEEGAANLVNKAESAAARLKAINSEITCFTVKEPFTSNNAFDLAKGKDLIIDASDNVYTRYLANDAAINASRESGKKIPLVLGAALRFDGQVSVWNTENGPCYRCVYPRPPKAQAVGTALTKGAFGPAVAITGSHMASEAIKLLVYGKDKTLAGKLLVIDELGNNYRVANLRPQQKTCCCCDSSLPLPDLPMDYPNQPKF